MNGNGEMKASRIGITLSVEEFNELVKLIPKIKDSITQYNSCLMSHKHPKLLLLLFSSVNLLLITQVGFEAADMLSPFACSYKGYCTLATEACAFRYVFIAYIALSDLECSDQSSCVVLE